MSKRIAFDADWRFHLGDFISIRNRWAWGKSGSWNQGPESAAFDDSDFRVVNLPHDYVFETQVYDYSTKEFDADNAIPAMEDVNNIHTTAGSFNKEVGWYRKHFTLSQDYEGEKIYLIFDGIYRDSMIWLNDFYIGGERSGYTQIRIDITDFVLYGEENVLAVKCDARQAEGWFYEGGGIYRHAWLELADTCHLENMYVHTVPTETPDKAQFVLSGDITEAGGAVISVCVEDEQKRQLVKWQQEVTSPAFETSCELGDIHLWSDASPYLYQVHVTLHNERGMVDSWSHSFGIRTAEYDSQRGFLLNGTQTKLKGVCCHQNHGGLGSALPDEILRYRIRKLKEMGANAYRCSHYPMTETFFQICDEEGMLAMAENRLFSSEKGDLQQLESLVKIARNHPSVILYSIGNEEAQSQITKQSRRIAQTMIRTIKRLDHTACVTMALLMWDLKNKKPITDTQALAGISEVLDVAGFNYHDENWEEFHSKYPKQPFICTEQGTFRSTRGCYHTDREVCHLAITDETENTYMQGAAMWRAALPDWVSGLFIWTGFDYYGEPSPFAWPAISSQFGAMDLCGNPKDFYYFYQAWWTHKPVLHVFPDMNVAPGEKVKYHVFSNAEEVELILNGQSLGRKTMRRNDYLVWDELEAQRGTLQAIGYCGGEKISEEVLRTAGSQTQIKVVQEYRENDIVVYRVELRDEMGNIVPDRDREYTIPEEYGILLGASNGNPSDHTPGSSRRRSTFHGLLQFIVRESRS